MGVARGGLEMKKLGAEAKIARTTSLPGKKPGKERGSGRGQEARMSRCQEVGKEERN